MSYKRFTKKDRYGHWCTDTKINDRYMWSEDGKVWERDLSHYAFDGEAIDRLAELEDKIESGRLMELPFIVVDRQTQKEADIYEIALKEDWAKDLCYSDMEGFAITQDGNLILLDECGKFVYCPYDRFEMIAEVRLKELQENDNERI